jgi:hypothetical protein
LVCSSFEGVVCFAPFALFSVAAALFLVCGGVWFCVCFFSEVGGLSSPSAFIKLSRAKFSVINSPFMKISLKSTYFLLRKHHN